MSRRNASSDSDSSDEDDVVGFKRAKRTSHSGRDDVSQSQPSRPTEPISNGARFIAPTPSWAARRMYNDRDCPDSGVSPGRSLTSPLVMKSVINRSMNGDNSRKQCEAPSIPCPSVELSSSEIMQVMGFEKGQGLAKYLAEVKTPGPKFSIDEFEKNVEDLGISLIDMELFTAEDIQLNQDTKWLLSQTESCQPLKFDDLVVGRKVGTALTKIEIDSNNAFIDPFVYTEVIECKKLYQNLDEHMYQIVRSKANLFERVNKGPFLCRAAMKMANLDAMLKFELTQPVTKEGKRVLGPHDLFYFSDICAGPGGFTEYILWKKKWEAKGFGLTLKGDLDFDVKNFVASAETFETFYGEAGDGNIYNPANVSGYIQHVLASTGNKGVHLLMGDGGFTVSKKEYLQEVLSHQIILSQLYVALAVVRVGGHVICKLFDAVTPFTVALIYFMYLSFDSVTVHKPLTSRPANSERYLICKWKKSRDVTSPIISYLANCHQFMWKSMNSENSDEKHTIVELLPVSTLSNILDPFYIYIRDCNNRLARKQIATLKRMVAFVRSSDLDNEKMQERARKAALKEWDIPEKLPFQNLRYSCDSACRNILSELPLTMLRHVEKDLIPGNVELLFKSAYDWRFVPISGTKNPNHANRGFYLSLGQDLVYRYSGSQWVIISQVEPVLELPSKTLIYGEFAHEIFGKSISEQYVIETFHIIDALALGGIDLRAMHYTQRQEMCVKFANALTNPGKLPIRAKTPIRMENLADFIGRLENCVVKGGGNGARLVCPLDMTEPYSPLVIPSGILLLKITRDPWQMALDFQSRKKYFFNTVSGVSSDQVPEDGISGFFNTMGNRVLWSWDQETNVILAKLDANDPRILQLSPNRLHTCNLVSYINYTIHQRPSISPPRTTLYVGAQKNSKDETKPNRLHDAKS